MIRAVRLYNCQSFEDEIMTFSSDVVNVIVAENDTGKSVLFKLLKLAGDADYYSAKDRADLIRRGCPYAKVLFFFTDGSYAIMQIETKKTLYSFLPTKDSPLNVSLTPPKEMVDRLELLVSPGQSFIANLVDREQAQLLVNPKLQSNYDLIRLIATNEDLDNLMERVSERIKVSRSNLIRTTDLGSYLNQQLQKISYVDVKSFEEKHRFMTAADEVLNSLCETIDSLERWERSRVNFVDYQRLGVILSVLEQVESMPTPVILPKLADSRILSVLEQIEEVAKYSDCIKVIEAPISEGLLEVLENLFAMEMFCNSIRKVSCGPPETLLEVLEQLQDLIVLLERITIADDTLIKSLENEFYSSGEVVSCPIYGEVVFDGKTCVADSA